jgi:hypothetical protein
MGQVTEVYKYTAFLPVTPSKGYIKIDLKEKVVGDNEMTQDGIPNPTKKNMEKQKCVNVLSLACSCKQSNRLPSSIKC